jgi:predicted metal-dependent peptidase
MTESSEFRISKQKVQLQKKNPFFAYLVLYLKFQPIEKGRMLCDTMGVDEKGNVYYVDDYVKKLKDTELIAVICHELCHLVFLTQLRQKNRSVEGWNCASDLAINTLLKANQFELPKDILIADVNDSFNCGTKKIKDVSKKTAEELYDEFPKVMKRGTTFYLVGENGQEGKELGKGFDNHLGSGEDGKGLSEEERKELEKDWLERVEEAVAVAKMKGNLPAGFERFIGKLHEEKIDWRTILNQFVTNQIPYDETWSRFSKKSVACGFPLPSQIKEKIDICLMVDLSGSIGQEEYSDFISELVGIAKAYSDRISIRVFSHDMECYDCGLIENGNTEKIMNMKLKGGGGTSFIQPLKYLKENNILPKCLLWFTDGYGDKVEKQEFPLLWIISKNGSDDLIKNSGEVIKLKED